MMGPKEKHERALGVRLGLKGERCATPKCAMVRKPYKPGVHGPRGRQKALSEFGLQLREKSKFKLTYGIDEKNLRRIFNQTVAKKQALGAGMLVFLERRLDNVVYRLGLAPSRGAARQLVVQGHIAVNGRKVVSPGFEVKANNVINVREGSLAMGAIAKRRDMLKKYDAPAWLHLDPEKLEGRVLSLPADVETPFEINLLVEAFSK
jgi:small subunit ribosomal protein S4